MLASKYVRIDYNSYDDFIKNYKIKAPKDFNFSFDVVDEIAKSNPNKKAIVWCNYENKEKIFTFNDIKNESNRAANFFKYLGIKKGDSVMLILKRRFEYWHCVIALHKIGALVIPVSHLLTKKEIEYRVKTAVVKTIIAIADEKIIKIINCVKDNCFGLKNLISVNGYVSGWFEYNYEIKKFKNVFHRSVNNNDIAALDKFLLYFTSGTTGMPKMVCHNFLYPLGHILTARFWQNLNDDSLHLTVADTGWAKASWGKIYGQWLCGASVFVYDYDRFNHCDLIEKVSKYCITSFCAPPTVYRYLIKDDLSKYDLSKLKYVESAGEPLSPEVFYKFKNSTGLCIKEGFGQTETVVFIANFPWINVRPGSAGKASPGWDIDIIDENNKSCGIYKKGRLIIKIKKQKPVGFFSGYYKNKILTNSVFVKNMYDTGDIVYKDKDGYIWFVGRSDDVIKSSGYRIGPFEVESILMEHPSVFECAITAIPDVIRGTIVKATIVLANGYIANNELIIELQNYVKKNIAPYKYPRIIEFVNELPKTTSGKIKRKVIRENNLKI
jgi:acetyl-CoA synthetase